MFCPKCGAQLPDDAGFCLKCGAKVSLVLGQQASTSKEQVFAPTGATALKCPSCVKPDTLILGDNIPISRMSVGGQVIGISGLGKVTKTFVRNYTGEMLRIQASGILPIELTSEHPLLTVRRSTSSHRMGKPRFSSPTWRHAHDVKPYDWLKMNGDYLVVPVPTGRFDDREMNLQTFTNQRGLSIARAKGYPVIFPLTEDTAWLLGIYVAEGCTTKKEIAFSLGKDEKELQDRIMHIGRMLGYSPYRKNTKTTTVVGIPSRILARAFSAWCGKRAPNKKVPDFILLHKDFSIFKSFFFAVVAGDGYEYRKRDVRNARISTTSKLLAMQLQLISARLGFHLSVNLASQEGTGTILGRKVKLHQKIEVRGQIELGRRQAIKSVGEFLYTPVRRVEKIQYSGPVHNLATQDGTYLVSNAVVHNCGAPITPKFGEMIITCDYCGSGITLGNEGWKSINKHTMLAVKLATQDDVVKIIHGQMDKGLFHRHLMEDSQLEEMNLAMVPYWLVPVSARTSLVATDMTTEAGTIATTAALAGIMGAAMGGGRGFGGGGMMTGVLLGTTMGGGGFGGGQGAKRAYEMDNDYNYPVVALKALTEYQPKDYQFNLADRMLFDQTKVKGMKVLNGDIGEDTAKYQAKTMVDQLQSEKAHKAHHMVQQLATESDMGDGELLHVPVWFARYDHKGTKIVLVIDGNSGGIVNSLGLSNQ